MLSLPAPSNLTDADLFYSSFDGEHRESQEAQDGQENGQHGEKGDGVTEEPFFLGQLGELVVEEADVRGHIGLECFCRCLQPADEGGRISAAYPDDECSSFWFVAQDGRFDLFAEGGVVKILYDADDPFAAVMVPTGLKRPSAATADSFRIRELVSERRFLLKFLPLVSRMPRVAI